MIEYTLERVASGEQQAPAAQLALMYGELGQLDTAFEHLHRAIDARDPAVIHLAVGPQWDCLRADRRFAQCLTRMGLPTIGG